MGNQTNKLQIFINRLTMHIRVCTINCQSSEKLIPAELDPDSALSAQEKTQAPAPAQENLFLALLNFDLA